MNHSNPSDPSRESKLLPLLAEARNGSPEIQNQLMGQLRSYFHLMAEHELGAAIKRKVENSDVVQQSCIKVVEAMEQFRGTTEGELRNWLKKVLTNEINQVGRDLRAQKRDYRREQPIHGDSRIGMPGAQPADLDLTPRANALAQEQADIVRTALAKLPDEYQQVIKLRSWQGLTFPQIAEALGKTINATEKLWYRAVQRLRRELSGYDDTNQP